MISSLVILGATGDLTGRFLLPALAQLLDRGELPEDITVVGAALRDWDDAQFRHHVRAELREHASDVPSAVLERLAAIARYRQADVTDGESMASLIKDVRADEERPVALYLALPAQVVPASVEALRVVALARGSRVVIEKPFGDDLASAVALNALLAEVVEGRAGVDVYRVDHVLGMESFANLVTMRLADRPLRAVWGGDDIERIEILWEETLALEGRAGYFDRAGMLKDVVQNHVMHVLAAVAMEPPDQPAQLRDRKVEVLRAARPTVDADGVVRSTRGRYTAGRLADDADGGGREVPSYADEDGVDPSRATETFAEVELEIDTPRWAGTRFVLRAGKALARRRKGVLVHFRPVDPTQDAQDARARSGRLWIGANPAELRLEVVGSESLDTLDASPVTMRSGPVEADLDAYGHVLLDILSGGDAHSVRADEAEEAWRILTPVLEAWRAGTVPMSKYRAGTPGPA